MVLPTRLDASLSSGVRKDYQISRLDRTERAFWIVSLMHNLCFLGRCGQLAVLAPESNLIRKALLPSEGVGLSSHYVMHTYI
jgi:hypothetical protein